MNIVVCVKHVPDTWADKKLDPTDKTVDRAGVDGVINELDEYGVEEALRLKEAHGGEVTVLTMGPEKAVEAVRKGLQMGADKGVHLKDDALHGSDAIQTAYAIAKVLGTLEWDIVIAGTEATDARTGILPALLAEHLGVPQLTKARKIEVDGTTIRIERETEDGYAKVEGSTPAVVSVVEKINEPRFTSFKNIMAAKNKPLAVLSIADVGIEADKVGLANAWTEVREFAERPPRTQGTIVKDEGDGAQKLAEFLQQQKFI